MFNYANNRYRGTILHWIDGDTIDLRVDLGQHVCTESRYRLYRIDAPETALRAGVTAQEKEAGLALKEQLSTAYPVGTQVWVATTKAGKYGRWLAELWVPDADGNWFNLNQHLLDKGLVASYPE